jgi:hypothetical protein
MDTISGDGTPFPKIHPGSILAVHEIFQGKAGLCVEQPLRLPNGIPGASTIWFAQIQ